MNLYIVESPLQLLCAYEAIKLNDSKYQILIRKTSRGENDIHLLNCANSLNLEYRAFLLRPSYVTKDFLKNLILWCEIALKRYNNVYFGSYYSGLMKLIRLFLTAKNFFYLDDGAATLRAQDCIIKKNKTVNWFTFFNIKPLDGQKVYIHDFSSLKKINANKNISGSYFIGQPIEIMKGFSKEDYLRCIRILSRKNPTGQKLFYIPHRVESPEFLEYVKKIENVEILEIGMPVELFFLIKKETQPQNIFSCYSTAIISLSKIFSNVQVYYIKNKNIKNIPVELEIVYKYFIDQNIKYLEL